jgi:hypothetical protein
MNGSGSDRAMTLIAHLVDVRNIQQSRVLGTVRSVTSNAAFCLYSNVLEDERTACLCMTLCANHILVSRRPQLIVAERPVRVVAVGALHQSFIYFVVKGLAEGGFVVRMAAETKLRLGRPK